MSFVWTELDWIYGSSVFSFSCYPLYLCRCLDKFCDPHSVGEVGLTDMMICAPWDTEMFQCLASGIDHTPCCAAKQLPPLCQELCSGNVSDINFKYFRCLSYMNQLSR